MRSLYPQGTLEEHIANLHILDFPQTAGYIADLQQRLDALENEINTQKLNQKKRLVKLNNSLEDK